MNHDSLRRLNRQSCLTPRNGTGLRGLVSDEAAAELRARNEARAAAIRQALGDHWVAHPESTHPGLFNKPKEH